MMLSISNMSHTVKMYVAHITRFSVLVLFAFFISYYANIPQGVVSEAAQTSNDLSGYAWSDNIGWISFKGTNYGVSFTQSTGNMSGYAWSDNIGWISFNASDVAGCPAAPCSPSIHNGTGVVTGWAKALSASGGWDGWIQLSGSWSPSVSFSSNVASGYSWGSDVVGWVSWSGVGYSVTKLVCENGANNPPACTTYDPCENGANNPPTCTTYDPCANGANNPPTCTVFTPTATLSASPTTIDQGQSATLTWSSTNATSCVGTGFTAGGASGTRSTGAINTPGTSNYQVVCTGAGGSSAPAFASVIVLAPNVSISADPIRVQSGSNSNVSWDASQVNSCAISGPGLSRTNYPGQQSVPISAQSTYTITCQTNGSPITDSVIVNILSEFQEF
jgi:hypothetical protein